MITYQRSDMDDCSQSAQSMHSSKSSNKLSSKPLPIIFQRLFDGLNEQTIEAIHAIDAVLPQTQCGLCGHHDGCLPYAHGIITQGEAINLCVPGGQAVTDRISQLTGRESLPASSSKWPIDPATQRPTAVRAIIRDSECIGCTKCIPACPVDAIIGTAKHMHSILTDLCTGCELCIAPCPVDCIDLVVHAHRPTEDARCREQAHLRQRYHQHLERVAESIETGSKPVVSTIESLMVNAMNQADTVSIDETDAKNTIMAAKLRTQLKKLQKQLAVAPSKDKELKIQEIEQQLMQLQNPNNQPSTDQGDL